MSPFCFRIAILKEHCAHLFQVPVQLIQGLALGMGISETGHIAHIEPGILTTFHYSRTFIFFLVRNSGLIS